jgi:hypothetical protein
MLLAIHSIQCNHSIKNLLILEGRFLSANIHGSHNVTELRHTLGISGFIVIPVEEAIEKRFKGVNNSTRSHRRIRDRHIIDSSYNHPLLCSAQVNLDHCSVNDLIVEASIMQLCGVVGKSVETRLGFVPHDTSQGTRFTPLF